MAGEIDCVIKLGGSAITFKDQFETHRLNDIRNVSIMIRQLYENGKKCIIVHGAGSFGHHQAKEYTINSGIDLEQPGRSRKGFCLTRCSVTKLNKIVVDSLVAAEVPAVSQSACGSWKTQDGVVVADNVAGIVELVTAGFVPVIHGDGVLDVSKGVAILSGDTIIKVMCEKAAVVRVIFLTDVAGVLTHPPEHVESKLIPRINVKHDGSTDLNFAMQSNSHTYDVTGGIMLKLNTALSIVRKSDGRTPVFVCRINSDAALQSCLSGGIGNIEGTLISMEK